MRTPFARGFTLIEMLITLSLVGILAAISIPSFAGLINRQRLASTTEDLHLAFSLARSEAIRRGGRVAVVPVSAKKWASGWLVFVDDNDDGKRATGGTGEPSEEVLMTFPAPDQAISIEADGSKLDEAVSFNDVGFARQPGSDGLALGRFVVRHTDGAVRTLCFSTARIRVVHADRCS